MNLKKLRQIVLSVSILVLSQLVYSHSQAQKLLGEDCPREQILNGYWAFHRFFTVGNGCLVQVTPIHKTTMIYREYVFYQSGRIVIFDSTPGTYETATSQRSYYLLPATQAPQLEQRGREVVVTTASGEQALFNDSDIFMLDFRGRGLIYKEEKVIDLSPEGHFQILSSQFPFIDAGWKIGTFAHSDPNSYSTLVFPGDIRCGIKNNFIFQYYDLITKEALYHPLLLLDTIEKVKLTKETFCK